MSTAPLPPPENPLKTAGTGLNMKKMCDFHGGPAPLRGGKTDKRTKRWKCALCVAGDNSAKGKP
jgi:hypothetical protein